MGWRRVCAEASLILALAAVACFVLAARSYELSRFAHRGVLLLTPVAIGLGFFGLKVPGDADGAVLCARVGVGISSAVFLTVFVSTCNPGSGDARRRVLGSNMRQIAMALRQYEFFEGRLPPAVVRDPQGRPLYSWRVLILPYMDETLVSREFRLAEPWDSPHNRRLLGNMPRAFRRHHQDTSGQGMTPIEAVSGPGTAFEGDGQPFANPDGSSNFSDGLDRTLLLVEAERSVPWTAPTEIEIGPARSMPSLGGIPARGGPWLAAEGPPSHFGAASADASAHFFPRSLGADKLRALSTRNGGEDAALAPE